MAGSLDLEDKAIADFMVLHIAGVVFPPFYQADPHDLSLASGAQAFMP